MDKLTLEQCIDWMMLNKGTNVISTHDGNYCIAEDGTLMMTFQDKWVNVGSFFSDFVNDIKNDKPIARKING